ncbi:choice-of-anchor Q domain-containing protein [Kitasatospora indigofera]|uniref:choice-of-anchor Q domain-containing protein n=1 Tax=Kitasatospora indigofera TaxID=67307 RepID=UPI003676139B
MCDLSSPQIGADETVIVGFVGVERLTANLFCGPAESGGAGGGSPDPRFVDPCGADFHLWSGSPAIAAGFAEAAPADDADRLLRDAPPDLGAYEHR